MSIVIKSKIKICKKSAFIGLLAGILIFGLVSSLFLQQQSQKKFAYVNIDKVIAYVMGQVNENNGQLVVSEEIARYKNVFAKTLDKYSSDHNITIFSSPKAIAGAEDITELLIKEAFGSAAAKSLEAGENG